MAVLRVGRVPTGPPDCLFGKSQVGEIIIPSWLEKSTYPGRPTLQRIGLPKNVMVFWEADHEKYVLFFFQVMFFLGKFGLCVYMLHILIHAYI